MKKILAILLLLGLMATSGMPLFINNVPVFVAYFLFCIFCVFVFGFNLKNYLPFFLLLFLLLFVQMLNSGIYFFPTLIAQMMIISTAVISVDVLGTRFLRYFVDIMTFLSIISLVIFIPILIMPSLADSMVANFPIHFEIETEAYGYEQLTHSFLFLNFPPDFFTRIRNAGPFWEAGVFGGFLFVALISNTILQNTIFNKRGFIFLIAILSTFSTTAYIALFLFIGVYFSIKVNSPLFKAFIVLLFGVLSLVAYSKLDFLGSKINDEIKQIAYDIQVQGGNSRMASAYLDITELTESKLYLFFGRGTHPENRVATDNKEVLRNNGTTDLIAVWGIPFFIFYFILMTRSFISVCRFFGEREFVAVLFVIILFILGFSEPYFRFGFFWALLLLYIPYSQYSKRASYSIS